MGTKMGSGLASSSSRRISSEELDECEEWVSARETVDGCVEVTFEETGVMFTALSLERLAHGLKERGMLAQRYEGAVTLAPVPSLLTVVVEDLGLWEKVAAEKTDGAPAKMDILSLVF
jgi:hypothetical protein